MSRSSELLPAARELLAARLSPRSLEHCERVAAQAVELALRFGVDAADAELAGLLHDYARDEGADGLLALAEDLSVPVTPFEVEHPYLIHARVGAALLRRELPGVGEAVLSAVELHTVGGLPMSDLDKVVYLADMIEPARTFPGVDTLRAACVTEPLAECFRLGYARSLRHVLEKGGPVHPVSAAVSAAIERETGTPLFEDPIEGGPETTLVELGGPDGGDAEDDPEEHGPAAAGPPDEDDDLERRVRRVRRRKAHRAHRAHDSGQATDVEQALAAEVEEGAARPRRGGSRARTAPLGVRIVKWVLTVVVSLALVAGAMVGLVLGVNAFARWNAIRIAGGPAVPTSAAENNLLVIGVDGGVATGFTALKTERKTGRVLGIAIPDGAFVEVPGQGFERIGASYVAGAEVSKDTVSNYLGVSFPRYVVVSGDAYQSLLSGQDVASLMGQIVQTDLKEDERASFAEYFGRVNPKNVWIVPLPVKPVAVGDQQYYEPQRDQVADLLLQWWGVKASEQKSTPRVIVYNGVGTPGLAGQAAQQLIRTGFRIVNSGNADNFDHATTQIYLYHGTQADAQAVRDALGVGQIVVQSAPQQLTDMIVIIGADYRPPVDGVSTVPTEGAQ